jgi:radical SAM superfamily enzyme YgiQ (UPF0313 family)
VLQRQNPDIVGISCYAATYGRAMELARLCKETGTSVVVGGEQITTLPHLMTDWMDVGVPREGEHVFLELLRRYDNGWEKTLFEGVRLTVSTNLCLKNRQIAIRSANI